MRSKAGQAFLISIYTVALYYFMYQLCGFFIAQTYGDKLSDTLAMTIGAVLTIPFIIYPLAFTPKPSGGSEGSRWEGALWVILTAVLGVVLNIVLARIPALINDETYRRAAESIRSGGFWQVLVCSGIVMPILEEMVFRGVLFGQMRSAFGTVAGVIISAVVFGAMHFNMAQFIYASIVGIALCLCYNRMKRLWFPILAHSLANIVVTILGHLGTIS